LRLVRTSTTSILSTGIVTPIAMSPTTATSLLIGPYSAVARQVVARNVTCSNENLGVHAPTGYAPPE
jgi:hypothetical protein